jgi:hypothetical protein
LWLHDQQLGRLLRHNGVNLTALAAKDQLCHMNYKLQDPLAANAVDTMLRQCVFPIPPAQWPCLILLHPIKTSDVDKWRKVDGLIEDAARTHYSATGVPAEDPICLQTISPDYFDPIYGNRRYITTPLASRIIRSVFNRSGTVPRWKSAREQRPP